MFNINHSVIRRWVDWVPATHWVLNMVSTTDLENVVCYVKIPPNENFEEEPWGLIRRFKKAQSSEANVTLEEGESLPSDPTVTSIIVCLVTDGLEPSIDRTLKEVECRKNMALLVLHPKAPHTTFTGQTQLRLERREFGVLGDVIDLLFWHPDGLYECDTNIAGLSKLVTFIKSTKRAPLGVGDTKADDDFVRVEKAQCKTGPIYYPYGGTYPPSDSIVQQVDCYVKTAPGTDLMGADRELWKRVESLLQGTSAKLNMTTEAGNGHSAKTIIICPVISRLGSNAEHAMKGVIGNKNIALICFHHLPPHVQMNKESQTVLRDEKFKRLGAIVDVLFWHELGLYECSVNQSAVSKICGFISPGSTSVIQK